MFFYGYQCCMKKHDIAQDTPSFPSDDEDEVLGSSAHRGCDVFGGGPSGKQAQSFVCICLFWSNVAQTAKFVKTLDALFIGIYLLDLFVFLTLFS